MKRILFSALLFSFLLIITGCAMNHYREGKRLYNSMAYNEAIPEFQKTLSKRSIPDAQIKLAESYRQINNTDKAIEEYAKVVALPEATPDHYLQYAKLLTRKGRYSDAKIWFDKYLEKNPNNESVKALSNSMSSMDDLLKDSLEYTVSSAQINSGQSNFSTARINDKIVFTSDRAKAAKRNLYNWTGRPFLNIYQSTVDGNGKWSDPEELAGDVNGKYHDGTPCFSTDGKTMYFTRNNYLKKKIGKSEQEVVNLKIFEATYADSVWKNLKALPFNSDEYSCGHPAITKDGNTLYFISDMPGGIGGTDLYKSTRSGDTWSAPVNLGASINTPFNEMFPTMQGDSILYFSSEGHTNMGGLDIFKSTISGGVLSAPQNVKYPLNSSYDDFSLMFNPGDTTGYISSNRKQSTEDNIYSFNKNVLRFILDGIAVEKSTQLPLEGVLIELTNSTTGKKETAVTGADGTFTFKLDQNSEYSVVGSKSNFYTQTEKVSTVGKKVSENMHVTLKLELEQIIVDKPIVLENIYYDLDKWNIRPDAALGLDKLVTIMKENPDINIELSSHTDARADDQYNKVLSQKRAEAAVNYIVSKDINRKRIVAKGYGESKLVNRCKNGVRCTEEEHQQNRRTEFKVTSINK